MQSNKPKKNFTDLISGIVVMALAAFFYWTTIGTKSFMKAGKGRLAPDAVPKVVAIAMFVLGVIIIVKWLINTKQGKIAPAEKEDDSANTEGMTEEQIKNRRLFQKITLPCTLVLIFLYILLMPKIGFTIATFFFLTLQITLLSTDISAKSCCQSDILSLRIRSQKKTVPVTYRNRLFFSLHNFSYSSWNSPSYRSGSVNPDLLFRVKPHTT